MKKKKLMSSIGYSIFRPLLRIYIFLFMNPKIVNKNNLPKKDGYILAGTHTSYFDPLIVGSSTIRPIHFLAKKELMDMPIIGKILSFMGIIRVDRSTKNPQAKSEAINALQNKQVICIYPEGTINKTKDKKILPFKYGAVSFAYKSGKPIIPFAIVGKPKMFNYHVKMILGKPYYVKTDDLEKENKILEDIVIKLIDEEANSMKKTKDKNLIYKILKTFFKVIYVLRFFPKVENKNLIPKEGPIILCGNHIHVYDQLTPMFNTKRIVHYMAKKEYFDTKFAWFFRAVGCISVNRSIHDDKAKSEAIDVLKNGYALGIFPEGTRNQIACRKERLKELYELYKNEMSLKKFKKILSKNYVRTSQIDLLNKLKDNKKISKNDYKKYILNSDYYLKKLIKKKIITKNDYIDSLMLPTKFGAVSMAQKTGAQIVPFVITGKYKFGKLRCQILNPFTVNKEDNLEDANKKLRNLMINNIYENM